MTSFLEIILYELPEKVYGTLIKLVCGRQKMPIGLDVI